MSKIGEILKAEREKKGLSLHEVGMGLKINPKTLKAIEDDDQKNLPAKTFLRGFIRSYAQYLRLDIDQISRQIQDEIGTTRPEEVRRPVVATPTVQSSGEDATPVSPNPTKDRPKTPSHPSQKVYTVVGSLVLLFIVIFVAKMVDKYQKESRRVTIDTPNPIAVEETPTPAVDSALVDNGLMTPIATPAVSSTGADVVAPVPTPLLAIPTTSVTPVQTPSVTPTPEPTPIATPSSTPLPSPTPTPSPAETPVGKSKPVEVIVEALNKVAIRYSFGDDNFETLTLMPDEFHTFKSKGSLNLEMSDGGAVSLIVNGRDRGVPGTIGKPLKLSFPK